MLLDSVSIAHLGEREVSSVRLKFTDKRTVGHLCLEPDEKPTTLVVNATKYVYTQLSSHDWVFLPLCICLY